MKKILILMGLISFTYAQDCSAYFASQQIQMDRKIEELDEAKQALESYKAAFLAIQKEKEEKNLAMLEEIKKEQDKLDEIRNNNAKILAEIRQLKNEITENKINKVSNAYAKMKDAAAAAILETMDEKEVIKIFLSLEAKKISSILAKMTPAKAGELTRLLSENKLQN